MILQASAKQIFKNSTKPDIKFLDTVLEAEYADDLIDADRILDRHNKRTLEQKLIEQPSWLLFYMSRKYELGSLLKFCEKKLDAKKGELWQSYTEKYSLDLTQTDKNNYISNHVEYLNVYEAFLMVQEQYNKFASVVDALTAQGYSLTNLTKIKLSDIEL